MHGKEKKCNGIKYFLLGEITTIDVCYALCNLVLKLTGYLNEKEAKTFTLRLWMDEETLHKEEYMNKLFKSKVTITMSYLAENQKHHWNKI